MLLTISFSVPTPTTAFLISARNFEPELICCTMPLIYVH